MKYKVRLTAPEIREFTLNKNYLFSYSDRMVSWLPTRSVEVFASIKDAETLQRLNPQHEVEIYSVNDRCYFPLWFFRKFEIFITADPTEEWGRAYFYYLTERGQPYEPSHPIVDQAPAFIYRPSTNFLIKKALYGMNKRGWKPCLGVTTAELVYTWVRVFKEQINGNN
jgi:hypothetical protein